MHVIEGVLRQYMHSERQTPKSLNKSATRQQPPLLLAIAVTLNTTSAIEYTPPTSSRHSCFTAHFIRKTHEKYRHGEYRTINGIIASRRDD